MGLKRSAALIFFVTHPLIWGILPPALPPPRPYLYLYLFRLDLHLSLLSRSYDLSPNMSSPYPAYGRQQPGANNPYMYPPNGASAPYSLNDSSSTIHGKYEFTSNRVSRTPSPTPSEAAELARDGLFDWKSMTNWRFWLRREWLCALKIVSRSIPRCFLANRLSFPSSGYYVLAVILTSITLIITVFHHQIVDKLTPIAHKIKE